MKKIILAAGIVVLFAFYLIYQHYNSASVQTAANPLTIVSPTPTSVATITPTPSTSGSGSTPPTPTPSSSSPTPTPTAVSTGQYKDGTYTGKVADAIYGNLQLAAVISGGKLTDVQFLDYPKDQSHSLQVSQNSLPQLKQEAIAAQTANVSIISGATQTSEAFQQSLASALAMAK